MADQAALLNQLRLQREEPAAARRAGRLWLVGGAVAFVLGGAGFAAMRFAAAPAEDLQTGVAAAALVAPPANPSAAAPVASILDASGYVVARRQATVSAK